MNRRRVDALVARIEKRQFEYRPAPSLAWRNDDGSFSLDAVAFNGKRQTIRAESWHPTMEDAESAWAQFKAQHGGGDAPLLIFDL